MTALPLRTRGRSRPWQTSRPGPGPTVPVEISNAPFDRVRRLLGIELEYIAHPSFDDPGAHDEILAPMPAPAADQAARCTKAPAGLPAYLASLYDMGPPLSREQEAHLFRKMNYLKYHAARVRDRIDPARPRTAELDEFERLLDEARAIKTQIVRANLRLVVSIAKRHLGRHDDLFERVSDGNYALMRAVERFDYARGNKFSTYATWTIRNQFARDIRDKNPRRRWFVPGGDDVSEIAAEPCTDGLELSDAQEQQEEMVARLLARLNVRERRIIAGRYGIGGGPAQTLTQLGEELGITKERVRQIESVAHSKLRWLAGTEELVGLLA
jgi:RNA polymerase primary sigma factor